MLKLTPQGLYCEDGDFYIDPSRGVDRAVVTHAHSDHARRGSREYFAERSGVGVLKSRLGGKINVRGLAYGERLQLGQACVSLHPAGHILGSAQVRIEARGQVWVASGDYKREPDPTCAPFEVVPCDVFVTEATFGTPSFRWETSAAAPGAPPRDLGREIHDWWRECADRGVNCLLFAYSLGKAQRVLGELAPHATRPVLTHDTVSELTRCYRDEGVRLAETRCLSELAPGEELRGELVLAPPSILKTELRARLGDYETAFASGWMQGGTEYGRGASYDRGFVMSDHADWDALVRTARETGARKVYVQHRGQGALVRHLKTLGIEAEPVEALTKPLVSQLSLF
jgi:putative mRNA 3-end processing factor